MRHLFWPCAVILALLLALQVVSLGYAAWVSPDSQTFVALREGRLSVEDAHVERPEVDGVNERPYAFLPPGLTVRFSGFPSRHDWSIDTYNNEKLFVPKSGQRDRPPGSAIRAMVVLRTGFAIPVLYLLTAWCAVTFLPARAWLIHRRRLKQGGCPACGYDLSGIDEAAPCPECGAKRA